MNAPTSRIAPPFPLNPTVGERHGAWVWNGVRWVCAPTTGIQVLAQVFTASGPYMPSPGLVSAVVECIGPGGGGGGVTLASGYVYGGGGGGGSGGYSRKVLPATLVMGGVAVTIPPGGPPSVGIGNGTFAGQTTFGALCIAYGGENANAFAPGTAGSLGEFGRGAVGGPTNGGPAVGDLALAGASGIYWATLHPQSSVPTTVWAQPGLGGTIFGGNNVAEPYGLNGSGPGQAGEPNSGSGGMGAVSNNGNNYPGGSGGSGVCIVTEYCWASASDGEDCMNPPINVNARVALTHVPWTGPGPCPPGWGGQGFIESDD